MALGVQLFWASLILLTAVRLYYTAALHLRRGFFTSTKSHQVVERKSSVVFVIVGFVICSLVLVLHSPIEEVVSIRPLIAQKWVRSWAFEPVFAPLGAVGIFLVACWLGWVHQTMGSQWSPVITVSASPQLVQSGPFAIVRHPMYALSWPLALFLALGTGNILVFLGFATICVSVSMRIPSEELALCSMFGDQYRVYSKKVRYRIMPGLW